MQLSAVSKAYGDDGLAVREVDLTLRNGEVLGLVGANGSGKSTLMGIMAGAIVPTAGEVSLLGQTPDSVQFRQTVGMATQDQSLDPELTPRELLSLFARLYGLSTSDRNARISSTIEHFELADFDRKRIAELSGGQRQRIHLGLLFLQQPQVMLLDEPTRALDPSMRERLRQRLTHQRDEGRVAVVATHELDSWKSLFSRLAFMSRGRIMAIDLPDRLIAQYGSLAEAYRQFCGESPPAENPSKRQHQRGTPRG